MSTARKIPTPIKDISCQDLLRYSDIIDCGYLRRRSAVNKLLDGVMKTSQMIRWPNTYVVLRGGCLYVFANERSKRASKASSLYGFSDVRECDQGELSGGVEWAFKVVSELELRNVVFYFCAPTSSDMTRWIACIQQEIVNANQFSDVASIPAPNLKPMRGPQQQQQQQWQQPEFPARNVAGSAPVKPPPRQAKPLPTHVELDYEMGEDDSDYEKIYDSAEEDSTNQTDSRKWKADSREDTDRAGKKGPLAGGMRMLPVASNLPTSRPFTNNSQPAAVASKFQQKSPPIVAMKPGRPVAGPKPPKPEPDKQQQQTKTRAGHCYSVERQTSDVMPESEEVAYMTNDDYPMFPITTKAAPLEPMVNEATWKGPSADGERFMRSLDVEGVYMIRASAKNPGQETLLVRINDSVRKYHITADEECRFFIEASGPHFDRLTEMIRYYRTNSLPCHSARLGLPYVKFMPK